MCVILCQTPDHGMSGNDRILQGLAPCLQR